MRRDFARPVLFSTIAGGVVTGVVTTGFSVSFAALIFKDELSVNLPIGTGLVLVTTLIVGVISAVWSSLRGLMAGVQDATAAVLGIAALSAVAGLAADEQLPVVMALIALSSVVTGVVLFALGKFRAGGLARFLPYTVVGGFLAATGVVIIEGALSILDFDPGDTPEASTVWAVWLPAAVIGVGFIVLQRLTRMTLTFPIGIVGSTVALHVGFLLAGSGRREAVDRGWLLGSGEQVAWSPSLASDAFGADWSAVLSEIGAVLTVSVLAAVALLVYAHSLEEALHQDIDLNRELMVAGIGNVAAGAAGGAPGYAYVANTVLLGRLGAPRRGAALVAAAVVAVALVAGPSLLSWIPRGVVGGLLLYVGATIVIDWVWGARDRLTIVDQGVILAVVVAVAVFGLVTGVVVGLGLAVATFVVRYSKIGVIERALALNEVPVSVERPEQERELLDEASDIAIVLELSGYLFFGTAHFLVEAVQERLERDPPLRYVIFSLERVTGVDASALSSFERVIRYGSDHGFLTIVAGSAGSGGPLHLAAPSGPVIQVEDLDDAVRVCQDEILRSAGIAGSEEGAHLLEEAIADDLGPEHAAAAMPFFERMELEAGSRIIVQGEPSPGLFYLESGRLTAVLERAGEPDLKLRTMRPGTIVGEMSLYRETEAAATVIADEPAVVMHVSVERFAELAEDDVLVTAWIHRFVARTLSARVDHANRTIRALRH